jgi:radical SAM superfamily enzyme YgiQ (UPF0313 family)
MRNTMSSRETIDALFLSYFEDIDRWHNDFAPSASGPTGSPVKLMKADDSGGRSILARTARQAVTLDGGVYDLPRFLSHAGYGSTTEYRRFDAFSLTHLSGKYYESLGKRHGYDVRHLNHVSRVDLEQLGKAFEPRYIMLSSTFMTETANIMDALQHIRRAWPGVPVVVGGLFLVEVEKAVSANDFQRLLTSFGADIYVVSPMGEEAFLAILGHTGDDYAGLDLPGSFVRSGRSFVKSETVEPGVSIDDNWVRWDELDPAGLYHTVHTRTARSCAFICSFCSYPANQGPLTLAQPETLRAELESMVRSGAVRSIVFTDDTFNVPMPRFKELCKVLAEFEFEWYSYFRSQFADEDTVRLMVDSGCKGAFLGYESLDDQVLKNMKKAATLKAYTRGTRMLKKHGIPCHANFIIGFPGDKAENTPKFIDFVDDEGIEFYYATPWFCSPATPIAKEKQLYGVEGDFYRWKHDTMHVEEAMELEEWCISRAKESVWITELAARNFWTELFLYGNGITVAEAQRLIRCFNKYVGKDTPKSALEADPEFLWLRDKLRTNEFPVPPGMEHYRSTAQQGQIQTTLN